MPKKNGAFILVASPSQTTNDEWREYYRKRGETYDAPSEVYQDYALLKVLYQLRRFNNNNPRIVLLKWDKSPTPINFSTLAEGDTIYIVGHGNPFGIYTMGPNPPNDKQQNTNRLVQLLTDDGSLKKKLRTFPVKLLLLSCRAGLGLHAVTAQKLYKVLASDITVGGAVGFTFGSTRTLSHALNEVLIEGLPWWMEYRDSIDLKKAEQITSNREKTSITYSSKEKEIKQFKINSHAIEVDLQKIVKKLKSTEVNKALDELSKSYRPDWEYQISLQYDLYYPAKINARLDFDMWFDDIVNSYVWTQGNNVQSRDVDSHLSKAADNPPSILTSVK